MAIIVKKDLVNGHEYVEDDRTGELTRAFYVGGLTPSAQITDDALVAVDSVTGDRIPSAGEQHGTMPDMVVRRVRPMPVGNSRTAIKIFVTYIKVRRRLLRVSMGGVSQQTLTNRDENGQIMTVGYRPPNDAGGDTTFPDTPFPPPSIDGKNGKYQYDYSRLPFLLPDSVLEIQYLEDSSPWEKWQKYGRRLNSKKFQGGDPRTWLCEAITGDIESPIPHNLSDLPDQKIVTGKAKFFWLVTYRFRYKPRPRLVSSGVVENGDSWDPLSLYVNPQVGRIPNDVLPITGGWPKKKIGNGWKEFRIYREIDHNELNLVSAVEKK